MGAVVDVYQHLITQGHAEGSTGWDIVKRMLSDVDVNDQLIVVTDDGGALPEIKEILGIGDSALHDIGVLVLVRGAPFKGDANLTKALDIFIELHGKRDVTLNGTQYMRIKAMTPEPIFIGLDDKNRPRHTTGYMLLVDA